MTDVVVVQISGGIGNQLFQYAIGRQIAWANHATLKLDISRYSASSLRAFKLPRLGVQAQLATTDDIMLSKGGPGPLGAMRRRLDRFRPYRHHHWVRERGFSFDPEVLRVSTPVYLQGYWQSEKYFRDVSSLIRDEIHLTTPISSYALQLDDEMATIKSVSMHVRKGDYVSDAVIRTRMSCLTANYYETAVRKLESLIGDFHLYVFSDEPEHMRGYIDVRRPVTIVGESASTDDCEDLWLMTRCNHNIIANSTFSWWGAWLNRKSDKIVISPSSWFDDKSYDDRDLVPSTWIKI